MPEGDDGSDLGPGSPPTPPLAEALAEVRKVLHDVDTTEPQHMGHSFYARAYHDLDINVRALLDAIDEAGIGSSPAAQTPVEGAGFPASAVELVAQLQELIGTKLVAYLGFTNVRTIISWADPSDPSIPPADALDRLLVAYQSAALIHQNDSIAVVQAWIQGRNPMLNDISPARFLRHGEVTDVGPKVLAAAREFAAGL